MRNMEFPKYVIEPAHADASTGVQPAAHAETVIEKVFSRPRAWQDSEHQLARRILTCLFEKRRLLAEDETDGRRETTDFEREAEPHMDRILRAIRTNRPLDLVLPAFPAKSPNRQKTLGHLPDLAEKHALQNLQTLCDDIASVYGPGAKVIICSDGRVFADLVCIPDAEVTAYGEYLRNYALTTHGDRFSFFNLDDAFQQTYSYDILREELLILYGESIASLYRRCKEEKEAKAMYLGITRFIFEDYSGIEPFCSGSRTAIQKVARLIAYRVIQRSNAWSRLLEDRFPDALRLSIHPQFRVSQKIGVYLGDTNGDGWLTPWHSVAVRHNGKISFSKRKDAEGCGMLAYDEGRPSHFEILDLENPLLRRNSTRGDNHDSDRKT
ncbi:MAG TPA: isocyanide synthase family protein [Gammaproteobacteria bacterium]|nr:isocyanide synthase family protein [Gammaproteobacteria bacterium]